MAEFLEDKPSLFLDPVEAPQFFSKPKSIQTKARQIQDFQYMLDMTPQEAVMTVESLEQNPENIVIDVRSLGPTPRGLLSQAINEGATAEEIQEIYAKNLEVENALRYVENFTAVDQYNAADPDVSKELFKAENRATRVRDMLTPIAEEWAGGSVDKVFEFVDEAVYDTFIGLNYIDEGFKGEGTELSALSREWADALFTMSDEEFEAHLQSRIEELTSGGEDILRASWRIRRELIALDAGGYLLWDKEMGYLGAVASSLDAATLGLAGGSLLTKAGKTVIGRMKSTAGTRQATQVAIDSPVVKGTSIAVREAPLEGQIIDDALPPGAKFTIGDDVLDAEIIEDIAPKAYASKVQPAYRATSVPPVNQSVLGQAFAANRFIRQFLWRESKQSFGTLDLSESAAAWAAREASSRVSKLGHRVIDVNVDDLGTQNFKATFTIGTGSGEAFKSFDEAMQVAKGQAGSSVLDLRTGARVTKDTKSGQYAVQVDTPVPTKELISALDLSEIYERTWVGRTFGRASIGSSSYLSNLADAAEAGVLGFKKDFKGTFNNLRRLNKKDAKIIDEIITTLRDSPTKGSSTQWLTTDEFIKAYRTFTSEDPSRKTVKAFEDLVALSDFSWWAKASERLKGVFNNKGLAIRIGEDRSVIGYPVEKVDKGQKVIDSVTGKVFSSNKLKDNQIVYELSVPDKGGAKYITNFHGRSRVPELTDVMEYTAGGPRSNPNVRYFVGQEGDNWVTAIGAKSERDGRDAVEQINKIINNPNDDSVVQANNSWMPQVTTWDQFEAFMKQEGLEIDKPVVARGRDERVANYIEIGDKHLLDLNFDAYTSWAKGDRPLALYGGVQAENPNPFLAILDQFQAMSTRAAKAQYRANHPTAWVNALKKAMDNKAIDAPEVPTWFATDENLVRSIKIKGQTEAARKLRQEQKVILRRLSQIEDSNQAFSWATGVDKATERALEIVHDWNPKVDPVAEWAVGKLKGTENTLLSLGFMQKMASMDQMLLQGSHIIQITAMSPKSGLKASTMAGYIRHAARAGDDAASKRLLYKHGQFYGMSKAEVDEMMEHMLLSGRGYMRGALVEDPNSAGLAKTGIGRVADLIRIPFYAGENYSQTASRLAAYFDVRREFPNLDPKSSLFLNKVRELDRTYSFGLTGSQKSVAQSAPILRTLTQWSSYQMRGFESVFFDKTLSVAQRARLAGAQTILWGATGLGLGSSAVWAYETLPPWMADLMVNGADTFFDWSLGVQVGERVANNPIQLIERGWMTFNDPMETIPAMNIGGDTATAAAGAITHALSGRWSASSHEVERLFRAWKIIDSPMIAYTMMMEDVRRTKTGSEVPGPFTTSQELMQAIGVTPTEVVDWYRGTTYMYNNKAKKADAVSKALPLYEEGFRRIQNGDYKGGQSIIMDADAVVQAYGLPPTYLAEAREDIFKQVGFDKISSTYIELVKQGALSYTTEVMLGKE